MKRISSRALPTTSPGKTEKRNAKALENVDALREFRDQLAERVKWIVDNSAARGSIPRLSEMTGLGKNTIRRLLQAKGGTTVDTVAILAITAGIRPAALFRPLSDSDKSMVKMLAGVRSEMESLKAKIGP